MTIVMVATDGGDSSAGALRFARQWADQREGDVELVTIGDMASGRRVQELLDDVFRTPPTWPHTVVSGDVAAELARVSTARDASLLVVGSGASSDPLISNEIARLAGVPVLVVPPGVRRLPSHAVLALDFSASSVRAATLALPVLARPARARMVSIGESGPPADLLFDIIEDSFGRPERVQFDRYCTTGEPAPEILRFIAANHADLIVVGRCGRSAKTCDTPGAIGRVARALLSRAPCSVLVA